MVADLRARAKRLYERDARQWAATDEVDPVLEVPLHPPTERAALADLQTTREWVASWRTASDEPDIEVVWDRRNWPRIGSQDVPVRAVVRGAAPIARVAGEEDAWGRLSERLRALRVAVGSSGQAVSALRSHARTIESLEPPDFDRLIDVLGWLRDNPASGRRIRELPIRGIHTKWIEARRGLVETLHSVGTGLTGLGLLEPSPLIRMRILDPTLTLGGLTDVSVPVDDLASLSFRPQHVYVFENLATVLAMPDEPGGIVIHGGGHRVDMVARLPWVRRVTYWGDLDSHGFAILHQLRGCGVEAISVLMDTETLMAHRDLWVDDPAPNTSVLGLLSAEENATLHLLSSQGNVRLEQERIPWAYALARLAHD